MRSLLSLIGLVGLLTVALFVGGAGAAPRQQPPPFPDEALRAYAEPICRNAQTILGEAEFAKKFGSMTKCVSKMMGEVRKVMEACLAGHQADVQRCITEGLKNLATGAGAGGTPKSQDTTPPRVRAYTLGVVKPGTTAQIVYGASDNTGTVKVRLRLFEGGRLVSDLTQTLKGATLGYVKRKWPVRLAGNLVGPLFYCVGAEDAAGNKTSPFPNSTCAWVSLLVPIAAVSNGCGGAGWAPLVKIQNYFGNEHTYDDTDGARYRVNFKPACDLHDAGYGGHTVADVIRGGTIDYRAKSRGQVDTKFLQDMRLLCDRAIPAKAKAALAKCKSTGGPLSIGAETLYNFVHKQGWRFFDADLTKPGIQQHGHRRN